MGEVLIFLLPLVVFTVSLFVIDGLYSLVEWLIERINDVLN